MSVGQEITSASETPVSHTGKPPSVLQQFAASSLTTPDESGCALIQDGRTALIARLALAKYASHTLDVQYYLWHDDETGKLLARGLLDAADRGVRVRMLIDDIHLAGRETGWAALDRHRNFSIRIFNPFRVRAWPSLKRLMEVIREGGRLNHRMHNKVFVADRTMALVGGRNVGDEYFAASPLANFRDMDLLALGPVVGEISASFETFWNSPYSVPVHTIAPVRPTKRFVRRWYRRLRRLRLARASLASYAELNPEQLRGELETLLARLHPGQASAIYDLPDKAGGSASARMTGAMRSLAGMAKQELLIESAYFIPDERTLGAIEVLRERGVEVTLLTNSLASNDVIAAHAGYAVHRRRLLQLGVKLFEVRSRVARIAPTVSGTQAGSQASLHSKAVVFDRKVVFIGTLNLDPRSFYINTEIGLIVQSEGLAREVASVIEQALDGHTSFSVRLEPEGPGATVRWYDSAAGGGRLVDEPESGWIRRLLSWIYQRVPLHHWL
jgi:putative cardiolipin synthase